MMYNESLKQEYLSWLQQNQNRHSYYVKKVFESASQLEELLGKEIVLFSPDELSVALSNAMIADYYTALRIRSLLVHYGEWYCGKAGVPVEKMHVQEFKPTKFDFSNVLSRTLSKDFMEVYLLLSRVIAQKSWSTIFPASVLAWAGISLYECVYIKEQDVDFNNQRILYHDEWRPLEQLETDVLKQYVDMDESILTQNQTYVRRKVQGEALIRPFKSKNSRFKTRQGVDKRAVLYHFSAAQDFLRTEFKNLAYDKLAYDMILRSGFFYRLHQWEKQGNDVFDFNNNQEVVRLVGWARKINVPSDMNGIYINYINYKRAFYPSEIAALPQKYIEMTTP